MFLRVCSCCIFFAFSALAFPENYFNSFVFLKIFEERIQRNPPKTIVVLFSDATSSSLSTEQNGTLAFFSSFATLDATKLFIIHDSKEALQKVAANFEKTDSFSLLDKSSFFSNLPEKIDLLYLAGNTDPEASSLELELFQLEDIEQLYPSLHEDSLIVLESIRSSQEGFVTKTIYPSLDYFLNEGWRKIYEDKYFLLEKKK